MNHLIKITMSNLPSGCINPTDEQILVAMSKAIAKESDMAKQLFKSRETIGGSFDLFSTVISGMLYDTFRKEKS